MTNNDVLEQIFSNDPMYIVEKGFIPIREREVESILSIGNGYIGSRNSLEEHYRTCDPATFIGGIYGRTHQGVEISSDYNVILKMPDWTKIQIFIEDNFVDLVEGTFIDKYRYVDLRSGLAIREWKNKDFLGRITTIKIIKFISLDNKNELYKKIVIKPENYSGKIRISSGIDGSKADFSRIASEIDKSNALLSLIMRTPGKNKKISMSQSSRFTREDEEIDFLDFKDREITYKTRSHSNMVFEEWEWRASLDITYSIDSVVSVYSSIETSHPYKESKKYLLKNDRNIFVPGFESHISKFQERWKDSEIIISNDFNAQKWINFALYHLIISGEFSGNNTSIPARGLSGMAYKGHIFWDTEIYMLPFYIFTKPEIARALLMYRYNTLKSARLNAKNIGLRGANFAWESTDSGLEMAPPFVLLPDGEIIQILSGKYENHITFDIAYAFWQYWTATLDEEFMADYGAEVIFETARFAASRLKQGEDGFYHIDKIIGPDEYHELVDDNAFTNLMAQHNLDIAIKIYDFLVTNYQDNYKKLKKKIKLEDEEIENWKEIKDKIYTGYNSETKLYEQFKGYFNLEDINIKDYEPRTAPMDVILGRDKISETRVIKQPDVVMFLFLLAEKFSQDIVAANYNYYEPRCGHGSSLSPSIYSLVAARLGNMQKAYQYFEQGALIDLQDNMGNAAGGVHMGALGGLWMAVVMGFGGMCLYEDGLLFDPNLPEQWEKLEFSINYHSQKISIKLSKTQSSFTVIGNKSIKISIGRYNWKDLEPNIEYLAYKNETWQWKQEGS